MRNLQQPCRRFVQIFMLALLLGINISSHAQTDTVSPLPPDAVPQSGTFYSAQNRPPMPFDWLPDLPVYSLGHGRFIIDDSSVDYADPGTWGATWRQGGNESAQPMDDNGVPSPGDGGDGGGTNSSGGGSPSYVFPTNGLWLWITGITNGIVSLNLNNATDLVYEILSTVSLTNPVVWNIEQEVWPVTNQNPTPFTVAVLDRTNSLFFWARDWTGVTENGNTTPEWWFYWYFGTTNLSDTNLDSTGHYTLSNDFQNGVDPNVIYFSLNVTNRYLNTGNATVQISVANGVPSYMTVLVDSTNFSTANWTTYNSNPFVNLGSVEGWHSVWVGLRGLPLDAQQTWEQIELKLVLTPPVLVITNPSTSTVMQPMIEVQGFCPEPLASLTFDLSNAAGFFPDQQALVLSQYYDTNAGGFTTNTFQAFDVALTNGANVVTFHATDPAGNVTTTNFTYTLDYSGKTNPPVIQVYWPQNGDQVSGTEFTLRGSLDDFTASLTARIVNASGNTNTVQGLVERNGLYWVESVPLLAGTNFVTLTAMDVVGNTATTNLTINVSAGVTISNFSGGLGGTPRTVIPVVTGTIALTHYTLWVNGVQATQYNNGTWEAESVPVGPGGTAVVEARAIPNSDNNGNGTGTAPPSDGTPSNPTAANSIAAQMQIDQPPTSYMQEYQSSSSFTITLDPGSCGEQQNTYTGQVDYVYMNGGTANFYENFFDVYDDCSSGTSWENQAFSWSDGESGVTNVVTFSGGGGFTSGASLGSALTSAQPYSSFAGSMPMAEWTLSQHDTGPYYDSTYIADETQSISTQMTLQTGGKGVPGNQNLFEIDVSALNYQPGEWVNGRFDGSVDQTGWGTSGLYPTAVPGNEITVQGETANTNGQIFMLLAGNASVPLTPQVPAQCDTYGVNAAPYALVHQTSCTATGNTNDARTTVGIGESVYLSGMPNSTTWSVSGGGALSATSGNNTTFIASMSPGTSTVTAQVGSIQLPTTFNVVAPTGSIVAPNPNQGLLGHSGTNKIGQSSIYTVYIAPTTVSFETVQFQENFLLFTNNFTWPNGANGTWPSGTLPIEVDCANQYSDTISDGLYPISYLDNGLEIGTNGINYVDFSYTINWGLQYQNNSGGWVTFKTNTTVTSFSGTSQSACVTYDGVQGVCPQGPFQ
jgi:hypothetical protein